MNVYDVTLFGLRLKLRPVAFSLPIGKSGWDIYWYGIIIATGFLLALLYAMKNSKRYGINTDRMLDVVLVTTPVSILCARTYYVLFDGERLTGIKDFFGFGESSGFAGLAIYGGVIGAFVCGAVMCKIRKVNLLDMFDLTAPCFLIGQGIGRWGNFVNQEAYGAFTGSSWWGMESDRTVSEMGQGLVHPCFLYESIWCIAGFFILNHFGKNRKFKGETALMYGVWYGFGRAIIEILRTDSLMIGKIKVSCLLSVIVCLASLAAIIVLRSRYRESVHDGDYGNVFAVQSESENESENGEPEQEPDNEEITEEPEEKDVSDN